MIKPHATSPDRTDRLICEQLYAQMTLIRHFEEKTLSLFDDGELFGTTHCYIGQEANAVGIINHLECGDVIFSNHRLPWSLPGLVGPSRLVDGRVDGP